MKSKKKIFNFNNTVNEGRKKNGEEYFAVNTSLVLEESRIGVDRLPIVDDSISTPVVEEYAPNSDLQQYQQQQQQHQQQQQQQQNQAYMIDNYTNHYIAYRDTIDLPTSLSVTQFVQPETLSSPYESELSQQQVSVVLSPSERVSSSMSVDSTVSDDVTTDDNHYQLPNDSLKQQQQQELSLPISSLPEQEILAEKPVNYTILVYILKY